MDSVLEDRQAKALLFVASANQGGARPLEKDVDEWIANPSPKPSERGKMISPGKKIGGFANPALGILGINSRLFNNIEKINRDRTVSIAGPLANLQTNQMGMLAKLAALSESWEEPPKYAPDTPAETFVEHLVRLGWLASNDKDRGLSITELGRALLRTHQSENSDDYLIDSIVLGKDDPLAYPHLIGRLAELEEGMIVDPYLRSEQLSHIIHFTTIARILISDRVEKKELASMAVMVASLTPDRPLEVAYCDGKTLHDRFIISENSIYSIGTSLNTVGKRHTTILSPLPESACGVIREEVEGWWSSASLLARNFDEDGDEDGDELS